MLEILVQHTWEGVTEEVVGIHKAVEIVMVDMNSQGNHSRIHQDLLVGHWAYANNGCGRGRWYGIHSDNNKTDNLYIPKEVIASIEPCYQAMLFQRRVQNGKRRQR
jgi:hypothetical protein